MAPTKREPGTHLKQRLEKDFFKYSFFQAVNLLEALRPEKDRIGRTFVPSREAVRFTVKPGFSFPPSDISSIRDEGDGSPMTMSVAFMGLIGPSGVLPQWYNAMAEERNRQKDQVINAFFDIFHHRLISLFYLAWKKGRLPENYTSGTGDRLSPYLLSLSGLGTKGLADMLGLPRESLAFYTGHLSRQVPSAAAIRGSVSYLAGTRVEVEQFMEKDIELAPEDCTKVGSQNAALGVDSICGSCVRDRQSSFRIHLGPMRYDEYERFLPVSGDLTRPIFFLVKYMVGMEYEFDIRIVLMHEEIPSCILGSGRQRLGWSTWLISPEEKPERDVSLTLQEKDVLASTA